MSSASDKTSDVRSKLEKEINNLLQPSNLQNDQELTSAIVNNNLPVSKIVNKLKSITNDIDTITDILSKCEFCVLSGDKSTVTVKRSTERTTILLRDIDEKATEEDIRGLFTDPNLGPIKRIEKELANTWLVTFDSETHAKSAALQAMKKEINGNKVHARLPSAIISTTSSDSTVLLHHNNNNITTTTTSPTGNTSTTTVGNESLDISPTLVNNNNNTSSSYDNNSTESYSYYTQYSQYYYPNSGYDYNNEDLPSNTPLGMYDNNIYMNEPTHKQYNNNNNGGSSRRGGGGGGGGGYYNRNRGYNNNNNNNRKDDNRRGNRRKYSRGGSGGGRNNNNNRRNDDYFNNSYYTSSSSSPQPVFQELSFPPLASDENTTTYKQPYISYTEDEIIKIVKNYTKFSLPPNLQPGDHSAAIGDKPNARLLELQRSMSIDQALEHSRPFRFDSVDSTDYSNMIYGNIDVDTLSKKPLPSSQTGIIPPPFEPKGYAAVVKTGKVQQIQPSSSSSSSTTTTTTTTTIPNNNNNKSTRSRTSSKDKKKDRKSKSNNNNNNTSAATTTWSYFPAESSSSPSNAANTESSTNGVNQSSNHHKSNRKGSNNLPSNKNNKTKSSSNTSDNSSTEPNQNSWASVVTKTSPSPKSDSSATVTASSSKVDSKTKADS